MKIHINRNIRGAIKIKFLFLIVLISIIAYLSATVLLDRSEEDLCNKMNEDIASFAQALKSGDNHSLKALNDEMEEIYESLTPTIKEDAPKPMTAPRGKAVVVGEQMAKEKTLRNIKKLKNSENGLSPSQVTQVARFYVILSNYEMFLKRFDIPVDAIDYL